LKIREAAKEYERKIGSELEAIEMKV